MEYTQEPLYYTAEEVVAKITEALNEAHTQTDLRIQRAKDNHNATVAETLLDTLKESVNDGICEKDYALELYNYVAKRMNWTTLNKWTSTYTVTVSFNGDIIAELEGIEGEDEDEAKEYVSDNFELWNVDATATFRINGNDYDLDVSSIEHELYDYFMNNLDYEATEE
jgi:hypothetical protein